MSVHVNALLIPFLCVLGLTHLSGCVHDHDPELDALLAQSRYSERHGNMGDVNECRSFRWPQIDLAVKGHHIACIRLPIAPR